MLKAKDIAPCDPSPVDTVASASKPAPSSGSRKRKSEMIKEEEEKCVVKLDEEEEEYERKEAQLEVSYGQNSCSLTAEDSLVRPNWRGLERHVWTTGRPRKLNVNQNLNRFFFLVRLLISRFKSFFTQNITVDE